jgi:hypothetical protein
MSIHPTPFLLNPTKSIYTVKWWPVIIITAGTAAMLPLWWWKKSTTDPETLHRDIPIDDLPQQHVSTQDTNTFKEHQFGRQTAKAAGMMEGDRAFRGMFDTRKAAKVFGAVIPATKPDHPSQEKHPENIIFKSR